jgi:nucleoside-diphosphate-sugar epimerase
MKVTTIRPFNPYGGNYRWKSESHGHVVPALVKRVLDGEDPLRVWGSGKQRRNLLHASDAARAILAVIENAPDAGPVNIGYDDDISIADLVQLICKSSGKHPRVEFDTSKPEGRFRKCADATRLRQLTAELRPRVTLEQGIQEMIEWYNRSFDPALAGAKTQG